MWGESYKSCLLDNVCDMINMGTWEHGNHFCAITKPCRYPSRLASALRMEFLIRRQIFGIESPKQFIKIGPDRDEKWSLRQRSNDKLQCWLI